jgi:hypothetical protein
MKQEMEAECMTSELQNLRHRNDSRRYESRF